jgi:hypothetical protein
VSARGLILLAVVPGLLGCLAGCGGSNTATTESAPAVPRDFFGMNAQLLEQVAERRKLDYVDHNATQMAGLGIGFVRSSFNWAAVEPNPPADGQHSYDFSTIDAWAGILAKHHLRWLATVKGGPIPAWAADHEAAGAGCGTNSPPAGDSDYASLVRALAERYGSDGSFWSDHPDLPREPITEYEIWNEPNFGRLWCPRPDPAAYARLYLAARAAIHEVDPKARVLLGGLASFRTDESGPPAKMSVQTFLQQAVKSEPALPRKVDAVAVHPYGATPDDVLTVLAWLRRTLDSVGMNGTAMSADEVGWHTMGELGVPPVPEAQRAHDFTVVTPGIALSACDMIGLAAHTWITSEQRTNYPEDWYGMADPVTGEPYASADAYGAQVKALEEGKPVPAAPEVCK